MKKLSEYEQLALNKLGESIHDGKWSNEGLVQLIELSRGFLNLITLQEYADKNKISYNGAKKRNISIELFGQKYVIDND
jgi:hypothetical protein